MIFDFSLVVPASHHTSSHFVRFASATLTSCTSLLPLLTSCTSLQPLLTSCASLRSHTQWCGIRRITFPLQKPPELRSSSYPVIFAKGKCMWLIAYAQKKHRPRSSYVFKTDTFKCATRGSNPGHPD